MKHDIRRMALAAVIPLFLLFILYILKFLETGMDWNFTRLGELTFCEQEITDANEDNSEGDGR